MSVNVVHFSVCVCVCASVCVSVCTQVECVSPLWGDVRGALPLRPL